MRDEQWLYDRLIRSGGPDFYWPMTEETHCTVGMDGSGDIKAVRASIKKVVEITREMTRIGDKREAMARAAAAEGHLVTARQNYFTAAAYYTMAQGPIHEDGNAVNLALSAKKNACYDKFIQYAGHRIEKVEVPFEATSLPGYLHFPPGVRPGAVRGVPRRHGQLQGNAGDQPERQVSRARDRGPDVRRAGPERSQDLA
jgi:hypothetical protein